MIQSGLEGDEEFSVLANMNLIYRLLTSFGNDNEITWLLKNRDIYFVPVASPDTYLLSAHIDGFNPIRSFPSPHKSNIQMIGNHSLLITGEVLGFLNDWFYSSCITARFVDKNGLFVSVSGLNVNSGMVRWQ